MMNLAKRHTFFTNDHVSEVTGGAPASRECCPHSLLMDDQRRDDPGEQVEHAVDCLKGIVDERKITNGLITGSFRPECRERRR